MRLDRLHVHDFRSYGDAELSLAPGLTALVGRNGQGKTNLLEALYYLAHFRSFRTPAGEVMIRNQHAAAHIRAVGRRGTDPDDGGFDAGTGREVLIEAEINRSGRNRVQLNGRRLARPGLATGQLRVTLFAPDDLAIVKEGPAGRRSWLDELATSLDPRFEAVLGSLERVLRQRGALLRQCGGRLDSSAALTLDVWDAKLAPLAESVMARREALVEQLATPLVEAYRALAAADPADHRRALDLVPAVRGGGDARAVLGHGEGPEEELLRATYRPSLNPGDALSCLMQARDQDLRRSASTVGPHRDELELVLGPRPVRTHASQGEQRCVALALKLAGHRLVTAEVGFAPLLLLDDVFSELDPQRCDALIANLPPGQTVLTSADRLPRTARADLVYEVSLDGVREVPLSAAPAHMVAEAADISPPEPSPASGART